MDRFWMFMSQMHSLAGPVMMLLYPLYASVMAIESTSKVDDDQWLAYWILYSFLTLMEMVLEPVLTWIPIWYDIKLGLVAWLVLPQLRGAAFIYERFVRQTLRQYGGAKFSVAKDHSLNGKTKLMDYISPKKLDRPIGVTDSKLLLRMTLIDGKINLSFDVMAPFSFVRIMITRKIYGR
ncbi:hypothetical protein GIB67_009393 [Kingdonia uniflora]|uniref:HVA22-like protein n=1 Tax=Kingdonia uniflora TaxID=39325 RepID=A0A7J7N379_9MAGN|nr:hypothetical protein GIB67_009393 [Kingdonia uniflora]